MTIEQHIRRAQRHIDNAIDELLEASKATENSKLERLAKTKLNCELEYERENLAEIRDHLGLL